MAFSARAATRDDARLSRLVDAARALADESGATTFTVSQLAARAGVSLKGFYGSVGGKDELLVALFAEESRRGAALIDASLDGDREQRLHAYVATLLAMAAWPGSAGYAAVLSREHRRLAEVHPDALEDALAPLVDLLRTVVGDDADLVFAVVLAGIHDVTLGRADPDELASRITTLFTRGVWRD